MNDKPNILTPATPETAKGNADWLQRFVRRQLGDCLLINADCLDVLPEIECDAVVTDPPYGVTACKWDVAPDLAQWWNALRCSGMVVMTSAQPFTSDLVKSNQAEYKCSMVWEKTKATGHLNAKLLPLRAHEDVLVFCRGRHTYNPQGLLRGNFKNSRPNKQATKTEDAYGQESEHGESEWGNYPTTIIKAKNRDTTNSHPTEKPVNLMTYLVETYTNPGDTVLDCYAGSGTTAIACIRTGRKFVGIEKDVKHFETACERVANELAQGVLLPPNH